MGPVILLTAVLLVASCGSDRPQTRGAGYFADHCAICHGADLRGGGGAGIEGLGNIPSDLTALAQANGGMFPRASVIAVLGNYAQGRQRGRMMRPLSHLASDDLQRVRTAEGRVHIPQPQADLLAYLEAVQRP